MRFILLGFFNIFMILQSCSLFAADFICGNKNEFFTMKQGDTITCGEGSYYSNSSPNQIGCYKNAEVQPLCTSSCEIGTVIESENRLYCTTHEKEKKFWSCLNEKSKELTARLKSDNGITDEEWKMEPHSSDKVSQIRDEVYKITHSAFTQSCKPNLL